MVQDDAVRSLVESLRELVGIANHIPDLLVIAGTTNVIEEIGGMAIKVAGLIHEYSKLAFIGKLMLGSFYEKVSL